MFAARPIMFGGAPHAAPHAAPMRAAPDLRASPPRRRAYAGPAFLSHGFRPFFFGAGVLAALLVPLWTLAYFGALDLGEAPLRWHMHEMLWGYLGAALSGFLFTAIPNWTGRLPISGAGLGGLFGLWLAARAAMLAGGQGALAALAGAFLVAVAALVWREVIAGRNWRNAVVALLVSVFAAAQLTFLFVSQDLGFRLGLGVAACMLMLIGGRVIPSFTRNWLARQNAKAMPAPMGRPDAAAILIAVAALAAWVAAPDSRLAGAGFAIAAIAHVWRLSRWRGAAARSEPLLLALHVAYAWLPVAYALFAASILAPGLAQPQQAIHALAAGAVGQMTLAVMTRASLGHSGRRLAATPATTAAYVCVFAGAVLRVASGWLAAPAPLLIGGAALWSLGFAIFAVAYAPIFVKPRPRRRPV